MQKSKIVFSNGEELLLNEGDVLVSVNSYELDGESLCSMYTGIMFNGFTLSHLTLLPLSVPDHSDSVLHSLRTEQSLLRCKGPPSCALPGSYPEFQ